MFTVVFDAQSKKPLYEQLYRYIKQSIETGSIMANQKLPSKRKLAAHLNISRFTVESAYAQLLAEGYVRTVQKKGYYACKIEPLLKSTDYPSLQPSVPLQTPAKLSFDLQTDTLDTTHFPYSVWSRLMRQCMRDEPGKLVNTIHPQGDLGLRMEIARFLHGFRGMDVSAEQIVLGAGTEYLLGLITELLPQATFAIEDPGYHKFSKLLTSRHLPFNPIALDSEGLIVEELNSRASVALVTPSHQSPLGIIMGISRRQQLLAWAMSASDKYLIEDDYNSEFHFVQRPIPTLFSLDTSGKVIYLNSFANTLAPSLRIAYMVLPETLLARYQETLYFYSCTVSELEQLTLKLFLKEAHFERHLNRMRKIYRKRQAAVIKGLEPLLHRALISGQQAGLHLLVKVPDQTEQKLVKSAAQKGVAVYPLSDYFFSPTLETHSVVIGFSGYQANQLFEAASRLAEAWS